MYFNFSQVLNLILARLLYFGIEMNKNIGTGHEKDWDRIGLKHDWTEKETGFKKQN